MFERDDETPSRDIGSTSGAVGVRQKHQGFLLLDSDWCFNMLCIMYYHVILQRRFYQTGTSKSPEWLVEPGLFEAIAGK